MRDVFHPKTDFFIYFMVERRTGFKIRNQQMVWGYGLRRSAHIIYLPTACYSLSDRELDQQIKITLL